MSVRLTDVLEKFDGSENQDVTEWLKKMELVASLQKIDGLARFIPLFLAKSAFSVYEQLDEESKNSYKAIKTALVKAFSITPFQAYEEFKTRRLRTQEPADVFLADLKRLMQLIGLDDERILVVQFVSGLPENIGSQVRAMKGENLELIEILNYTKAILADKYSDKPTCVAAHPSSNVVNLNTKTTRTPLKCWGCGGPHIKRYCKSKCQVCHEIGHDSYKIKSYKYCQDSGNGQWESQCAPALDSQW